MLLFALVAHEFAHGYAALRQGDDTALKLGRLTLNPIPHIDPIMTLAMPALLWFLSGGRFTFGGARPVPVVPRNFRNYRRGDLIVSSAGVVTNAVLSIVCTLLVIALGAAHNALGGPGTSTVSVAQQMLVYGIQVNLILAVFNLIPIPPLDGSRILYHFLPTPIALKYRSLDRFGFLPILVLLTVFKGVAAALMTPAWIGIDVLQNLAAPFAVMVDPGLYPS